MNRVKINNTKEELIRELEFLRHRVCELEKLEARHKQESNALKENYRKLNSIFASFRDLVFVLDKEGRFTEFYVPGEELYVPPKEFIGKKYSEVLPPYVNKLITEAFNKNKRGGVDEYEYPLEIAGKKQWYSAKQSPLFKDRQFTGSVVVIRNITEQKKLIQQLKESEERYRALIDLGARLVKLS